MGNKPEDQIEDVYGIEMIEYLLRDPASKRTSKAG